MSFTDQKQRVATEQDIKAPWNGAKGGKRFYCRLCGHQFKVGDKWRWVYAGSIHRLNFLVCEQCDGEGVLEKWNKWWEEWEELSKGKFRYIADMLEDRQVETERRG